MRLLALLLAIQALGGCTWFSHSIDLVRGGLDQPCFTDGTCSHGLDCVQAGWHQHVCAMGSAKPQGAIQ